MFFKGNWGIFLKHFVEDVGNFWCPTWIKRNYYMENPPEHVPDTAVALQERLKYRWLFPESDNEEEKPEALSADKEEAKTDDTPSTGVQTLQKPMAPVEIQSDDEKPDSAPAPSWKHSITSGEPQLDPDGFAPQSYDTDHH